MYMGLILVVNTTIYAHIYLLIILIAQFGVTCSIGIQFTWKHSYENKHLWILHLSYL